MHFVVFLSDVAVSSCCCCTWILCSHKYQKSSQIQHVSRSPAVLLCTQSFLICDLCFVCCSHRCVLLSPHLIITLRLLNLSFWLHDCLSLFLRFPLLFSTPFLLPCLFVFFLFSRASFLFSPLSTPTPLTVQTGEWLISYLAGQWFIRLMTPPLTWLARDPIRALYDPTVCVCVCLWVNSLKLSNICSVP